LKLPGNKSNYERNIMGELVELLQQKAGLSPDKAQEVAQIVVQHLTERVPSQFQGILSSVLGSGAAPAADGSSGGGFGSLLGEASSFFNKG
jgi:hypothetical protein